MKRTSLIAFTGLAALAGIQLTCSAAEKTAAEKATLILFTAGGDGHGKGHHEVAAVLRLLKDCVDKSTNVKGIRTEFRAGWPKEEDPAFSKLVEKVDCFVFKGDAFPINAHQYKNKAVYKAHRARLDAAMKRGAGIVLLHYATGSRDRKDKLGEWAGGYFSMKGPSKVTGNAHLAKVIQTDAKHPVAKGWESFDFRDEFYYDYWNGEAKVDDVKGNGLKPVAHIILKTKKHPVPSREIVAWTYERKGGGRAFVSWASHWYLNWRHEGMRRMTLNGILWAAKMEVPEKGVESKLPADLNAYKPKRVRGTGYRGWPK